MINRKTGIALVITLATMTGLCIAGLSILALLLREQRLEALQASSLSMEAAAQGAVQTGVWEIRSQVTAEAFNGPYTGSTIHSASDSASSLYFENRIQPANSLLNLLGNTPEMYNTLQHLGQEIERPTLRSALIPSGTFRGRFSRRVDHLIAAHRGAGVEWALHQVSETVKPSPSDFNQRALVYLKPYLTIYPPALPESMVNILDYGRCLAAGTSEYTLAAQSRDFKPADFDGVSGAMVEILSGAARGQKNRVRGIRNAFTLEMETPWSGTATNDAGVSTGVLPEENSIYRLYTLATPLNFNSAPRELLLAVFRAARAIPELSGLPLTEMARRLDARAGPMPNAPKTRYADLDHWECEFLEGFPGLSAGEKKLLRRLLDPLAPKGIEQGGLIRIHPLPLPLTFHHDGHFIMQISAGEKRSRANREPTFAFSRQALVRTHGTLNHSFRRHFEAELDTNPDGHIFHWMTASDWVPAWNLDSYGEWSPVAPPDFNVYPESARTPAVIPDAIKTGLWYDFKATHHGLGGDRVFDALSGQYDLAGNLQHWFLPLPGANGLEGHVDLEHVPLKISGATVSGSENPDTEVTLYGNRDLLGREATPEEDEAYIFGDLAIMTVIRDEAQDFWTMPHPPGDPKWYDTRFRAGDGTFMGHAHADHLPLAGTDRITYPPERYATPAFYARKDGPGKISWRAEYGYDDPGDYHQESFYRCLPGGERPLPDGYSVLIANKWMDRYQVFSTNPYDDSPKVFALAANYFGHQLLEARMGNHETSEFENPSAVSLAARHWIPDLPDAGRIGYLRYFPATIPPDARGYFHTHDAKAAAPFTVEYLRLIAGTRRDDLGRVSRPFYLSPIQTLPQGTALIEARIRYRCGLRPDTASPFLNRDRFCFRLHLEIDPDPESPLRERFLPATQVVQEVFIRDMEATEGELVYRFQPPLPLAPSDFSRVAYRLDIENYPSLEAEHLAFLKTTLAITQVRMIYSQIPEVIYIDTET